MIGSSEDDQIEETNFVAVLQKQITFLFVKMGASLSAKESVKLLFLDVDGVLNSMDSCRQNTEIQDEKLKLLKTIIDSTNAEIVISSSWRLNETELKQLEYSLNKYNMEHIGCTPKIFFRTDEIKAFMNNYLKANKNIKITNWIAIDDMDLNKYNPKMMDGHFVKTSLLSGLTQFDVEKAIKLLNT